MAGYRVGDTLTVEVPLFDTNGAPIPTASSGDFTATIRHTARDGTRSAATVGPFAYDAGGLYLAAIAGALEGRYSGTIVYAGPPAQPFGWEADVETAAQADPAAALAAVDITLVSPLSPDGGTLRLIQGDSYAAAQSRQISWDLTGQPDLSAATTTLLIKVGSATVSKVITPTNPASGSPTLTATLTKVETASLDAAQIGVFDVSAAIGSDELTLIRGKVYVTADVTA
jgi:hypothetical protein